MTCCSLCSLSWSLNLLSMLLTRAAWEFSNLSFSADPLLWRDSKIVSNFLVASSWSVLACSFCCYKNANWFSQRTRSLSYWASMSESCFSKSYIVALALSFSIMNASRSRIIKWWFSAIYFLRVEISALTLAWDSNLLLSIEAIFSSRIAFSLFASLSCFYRAYS